MAEAQAFPSFSPVDFPATRAAAHQASQLAEAALGHHPDSKVHIFEKYLTTPKRCYTSYVSGAGMGVGMVSGEFCSRVSFCGPCHCKHGPRNR